MQMQADFLGCRIIRPKMIETTALGAAFLAGLGVGVWQNFNEIDRAWKMDQEFQPGIDEQERSRVLERWCEAVKKA